MCVRLARARPPRRPPRRSEAGANGFFVGAGFPEAPAKTQNFPEASPKFSLCLPRRPLKMSNYPCAGQLSVKLWRCFGETLKKRGASGKLWRCFGVNPLKKGCCGEAFASADHPYQSLSRCMCVGVARAPAHRGAQRGAARASQGQPGAAKSSHWEPKTERLS